MSPVSAPGACEGERAGLTSALRRSILRHMRAKALQVGDKLREGTSIEKVEPNTPSPGHVRCTLSDGRTLIAPNHYLIDAARPKLGHAGVST